jgi:hypothetical protein
MPGMIAASWAEGNSEQARDLFDDACAKYTAFKGLACKSRFLGAGCAIARLPGAKSPCPDIHQAEDGEIVLAAAGWWFDPESPESEQPSLEVLADRYRLEKEKALHRLQGQYLVLARGPDKDELIAWSDPLGMFPVYVAESAGISWCSTSALALAAVLHSQLDTEALRGLFMDGTIRTPRTAFLGIRRLGIGEQARLARGDAQINRVWSPFCSPRDYRRIEEAAEEGLALIRRSCRRIYQIWPRCVCDLTGGLDSRLVVAAAASQQLPVQVTVTGHESDLDVTIARDIAERMRWPMEHFSEPTDWGQQRWELFKRGVALADGELPGSAVDGTIRVKLALSERFDAAVVGGGGELYRDFFWQQEYWRIGKTSDLDLPRLFRYRFFFSGGPRISLFRGDWRPDYLNGQIKVAQQIVDLEPEALNTAKLDALYLWKCSGHFARYGGAMNPLIASTFPLFSRDLFEYSASLPWRYRVGGGRLEREIIAMAHPKLAAMPTAYGGSAKPMRMTRPQNYLPYAVNAFKKGVRKLGQLTIKRSIFPMPCSPKQNPEVNKDLALVLAREGFLRPDNLQAAGAYDPDGLREFLSSARQPGFSDFKQLYALVTVELLCRMCDLTLEGREF